MLGWPHPFQSLFVSSAAVSGVSIQACLREHFTYLFQSDQVEGWVLRAFEQDLECVEPCIDVDIVDSVVVVITVYSIRLYKW